MSNTDYIDQLKSEIVVLQTRVRVLDEKLQNCEAIRQTLDAESGAARKIIWAIAHSQNGSIEIPDESMQMAGNGLNQITSKYDPERKVTVISAIAESPILKK